MLVGAERGTIARAELGKGGAVLAWESSFLVGDVRWLEVEDPVLGPGPEGGVHILCMEQLSGLPSVLNSSVFTEALDFVAKLLLECFLHIPRTWV